MTNKTRKPHRRNAPDTVDALVQRFARIEAWFHTPLFECRLCGRLFQPMTDMQLAKKGGYFDITVRLCRVSRMKNEPRLTWLIDNCVACQQQRKGPLNG